MSTKKIIFWEDAGFLTFLLANSLQKKIKDEFYAIFDVTDRQKSFYQKQKLVDFKKIWFFHDAISKPQKKVDIEFLAILHLGESKTMLSENSEPMSHEDMVVRLVASSTPEGFHAGFLSKGYPDFGDKNTLKVKADDLHSVHGSVVSPMR